MGYYTDYKLTIEVGDRYALQHYLTVLNSAYEFIEYFTTTDGKGEGFANSKWYEYDADMKNLSEHSPHEMFTLHGEGEDGLEDAWVAYYKNGKGCKSFAQVIFDPFDESKLL